MTPLARKLQLKDDDDGIRVLNAPPDLALNLPTTDDARAVLVFVRDRAQLDAEAAPALDAARDDRLAWIAYPKGGQLGADLNRDLLWDTLKGQGLRPVRQISIDDIWSALRFRPA